MTSLFPKISLVVPTLFISGFYGVLTAQTVTNASQLAAAVASANSDGSKKNHSITLIDGQTYTLSGSSLTITSKISLSGNATIDGGGLPIALYVISPGNLTINNVTIRNSGSPNSANCIFNSGGKVTLNGATVSGCISGQLVGGAGITNDGAGGTVTLNSSTVSNNSLTSPLQGGGAGIFNQSSLVVNDSTIQSNSALSGGAIANFGDATINSSNIVGNTATSVGGGIYNDGSGTLILNKCNVTGNSAVTGRDIFNLGSITVDKSTVIGNMAP